MLTGCGLAVWAAAAAAQNLSPAATDLNAIVARMQSSLKVNGMLAEQYTSDELWHNVNVNKDGKTTVDESAKYENVFVEGLPYRRKVDENGKPLAGKAAAEEEKRYKKAVEERRTMSVAEKRGLLHRTSHWSLPICCLTTLFDNRVTGEAMVNGRKILVVESTPRAGAQAASPEEATALNWKETTWIDQEDHLPVRLEAEALEKTGMMLKGSTMRLDWERLPPSPEDSSGQAVWVEEGFVSHFQMKTMFMTFRGTTEETYSNYRKFHVDVRLLDDSMEPAPEMPPAGQPR